MTGKQLCRRRRKLGLTQAALAAKLGVSSLTVARWEWGTVPIREPMARLIQFLSTAERGSSGKTSSARRRPRRR